MHPVFARLATCVLFALAPMFALAAAPASAPAAVDHLTTHPEKIIWVGSSYLFAGDMHDVFARLAHAAEPAWNVQSKTVYQGGTDMTGHIQKGSLQQITPGWDMLVVHSYTGETLNADVFFGAAKQFITTARKAGIEPMMMLVWGSQSELKTEQQHQHLLSAARQYRLLQQRESVRVAPVGLAWRRMFQQHPEIPLFTDEYHATPQGAYLTVCVLYGSITGKPISTLPTTEGLDEPTAKLLREAAVQGMQDFKELKLPTD